MYFFILFLLFDTLILIFVFSLIKNLANKRKKVVEIPENRFKTLDEKVFSANHVSKIINTEIYLIIFGGISFFGGIYCILYLFTRNLLPHYLTQSEADAILLSIIIIITAITLNFILNGFFQRKKEWQKIKGREIIFSQKYLKISKSILARRVKSNLIEEIESYCVIEWKNIKELQIKRFTSNKSSNPYFLIILNDNQYVYVVRTLLLYVLFENKENQIINEFKKHISNLVVEEPIY